MGRVSSPPSVGMTTVLPTADDGIGMRARRDTVGHPHLLLAFFMDHVRRKYLIINSKIPFISNKFQANRDAQLL